jgi:hypothetical protein
MSRDADTWLAHTIFEEYGANFRLVWDQYLKFYTVWLTVNVTAIGVVIKLDPHPRWPIGVAFIIQNLLAAGASYLVAQYSMRVAIGLKELVHHLAGSDEEETALSEKSEPSQLARFTGIANLVSCLTLAGCWLAVCLIA